MLLTAEALTALANWGTALGAAIESLRAFLPLEKTIATLNTLPAPEAIATILSTLAGRVAELPEPSAQNAAAALLSVAQERLTTLRSANAAHGRAADQSRIAGRISAIYAEETEAALEAIYQKVQIRFSELYRQLNAEDESAFEAEMKQDKASLDFKVDFYKRGKFPPGAYHSEGHQDSMGLCLYLALMDHLQGKRFTFAVLDDVLMSVDTGHRREVTRMLKAEFPGSFTFEWVMPEALTADEQAVFGTRERVAALVGGLPTSATGANLRRRNFLGSEQGDHSLLCPT
jgi:alkanesulfonate monooxygenase SsuD/methylene tetrahydromethanopterin reductase-like flavin-dependent oxidoreductase (luciferase family)